MSRTMKFALALVAIVVVWKLYSSVTPDTVEYEPDAQTETA